MVVTSRCRVLGGQSSGSRQLSDGTGAVRGQAIGAIVAVDDRSTPAQLRATRAPTQSPTEVTPLDVRLSTCGGGAVTGELLCWAAVEGTTTWAADEANTKRRPRAGLLSARAAERREMTAVELGLLLCREAQLCLRRDRGGNSTTPLKAVTPLMGAVLVATARGPPTPSNGAMRYQPNLRDGRQPPPTLAELPIPLHPYDGLPSSLHNIAALRCTPLPSLRSIHIPGMQRLRPLLHPRRVAISIPQVDLPNSLNRKQPRSPLSLIAALFPSHPMTPIYASYSTLLRTSILVTFFLLLKFLIVNLRWARAKGWAGLRPPEDRQNRNPTPQRLTEAERARLVVFNDLENIPVGLIIVWASALCVGFSAAVDSTGSHSVQRWTTSLVPAHVLLTVLFGVVRVAHSVVYSLGMAPRLRMVLFVSGMVSLFSLCFIGVVAAFRSESDGGG